MADQKPVDERRPVACPFQKREPPTKREIVLTGGNLIVPDAIICDLKAPHDRQGRILLVLPTPGMDIRCNYVGNEGNCPLMQKQMQT